MRRYEGGAWRRAGTGSEFLVFGFWFLVTSQAGNALLSMQFRVESLDSQQKNCHSERAERVEESPEVRDDAAGTAMI